MAGLMSEHYRAPAARGEIGRRLRTVAGLSGLALLLGACSFSIPSLVAKPEDTTGSITPRVASPLSADLAPEDWRRAKGTLAIALDPQGNGEPVKWDNPDTGYKGVFTPVGQPFVKADEVCRVFLATIEHPDGRSSSLQGTGCKLSADEWEIQEVKPWRKSA